MMEPNAVAEIRARHDEHGSDSSRRACETCRWLRLIAAAPRMRETLSRLTALACARRARTMPTKVVYFAREGDTNGHHD